MSDGSGRTFAFAGGDIRLSDMIDGRLARAM